MGAGVTHRLRLRMWLLLATTLLCLPSVGAAAPDASLESVTVGVYSVAPFIVADANGARGILIEFFDREVAPRMGVKFKWTAPTTVARLEQNLMRGAVAFSPILARTPERESARIVFAGDVHVRFEPCIAVMPGHPVNAIASVADLSGMTIGWVRAAAIPAFLRDAPVRFDLISTVDWEKANLEKLRLGRIDGAFFSDQFTPKYYAYQTGARLKLLMLPGPGAALYGAFSPAAPAGLIARYRSAARAAFANGRWETYLNKALATAAP